MMRKCCLLFLVLLCASVGLYCGDTPPTQQGESTKEISQSTEMAIEQSVQEKAPERPAQEPGNELGGNAEPAQPVESAGDGGVEPAVPDRVPDKINPQEKLPPKDEVAPEIQPPDQQAGGIPPVPKIPLKSLHVTLPSAGSIPVLLHPGSAAIGKSVLVSFGVPFPKNVLLDDTKVKITDANGVELPSHVKSLVHWNLLLGVNKAKSIRSVLVYVKTNFANKNPKKLLVQYGRTRTKKLGAQGAATGNWVSISQGPYPTEYATKEGLKEPLVYATLPPEWLGACLLRTRSVKAHGDTSWKWYDDFFVSSGLTAVNRVDSKVKDSEKIKYQTAYAPWLFDRALTLFGIYIRTGKVEWLRHAHRAAQFYAKHINSRGYFDLKSNDLKYSYGQAMLIDLMLTGDVRLLPKIQLVANVGKAWNATYTLRSNFWTERHQTYALLAALSAWEATGKKEYGDRVKVIFDASYKMTMTPVSSSWPKDGCMLHLFRAHEGFERTKHPICSPWMTALFGDAVMRYYIHSGDKRALTLLAKFGHFIRQHATYTDPNKKLKVKVPWYLVSSLYRFSGSGPWGDLEHTCDVGGLVARGLWATKMLGQNTTAMEAITKDYLAACQQNLKNWHRPGGPTAGKPVWRLSPPRKFNWWFGSTHDFEWLVKASK